MSNLSNSDALAEFRRVMMPMIRKVMPAMLAQEITGVQPMSTPQQMEIGETYLNDANLYSKPGDPVEYYWAKPPAPSIFNMSLFKTVKDTDDLFREMRNWTTETFGEVGGSWLYIDSKFCFTNEADRMLFVLRWK
jgi:hypothetical protein